MTVCGRWCLVVGLLVSPSMVGGPAERRAALLEEARKAKPSAAILGQGVSDENAVVRRTAAQALAQLGMPARAALEKALGDTDVVVRRTALTGLLRLEGVDPVPYLTPAIKDEHVLMRQLAVQHLIAIQPRPPAVQVLLEEAAKDKNDKVRRIAARATWPFHKETISIRERKDWDHDVVVAQAIPLPKDGWKFHLDSDRSGHRKVWFKPALDDSKWADISIEQAWQKAGYDYIGVAWYRRTIELPAKPDHLAVELHFKGVDECAWVWVNGKYVGQHDVGPTGWNQPFLLDATKEVKWGEANQITVRAMNTAHAGGIWRPVAIEILK